MFGLTATAPRVAVVGAQESVSKGGEMLGSAGEVSVASQRSNDSWRSPEAESGQRVGTVKVAVSSFPVTLPIFPSSPTRCADQNSHSRASQRTGLRQWD